MKIKIRSDDASTLREDGWSQMGDWLASLRDGNRAEPPGDGDAAADGTDVPWSEALNPAAAGRSGHSRRPTNGLKANLRLLP